MPSRTPFGVWYAITCEASPYEPGTPARFVQRSKRRSGSGRSFLADRRMPRTSLGAARNDRGTGGPLPLSRSVCSPKYHCAEVTVMKSARTLIDRRRLLGGAAAAALGAGSASRRVEADGQPAASGKPTEFQIACMTYVYR